MQPRKKTCCSPKFFLVLTILAALGFALTFYCGVFDAAAPLWKHVAVSAVPMLVLFFLWQLSRRGRWNGAAAFVITLFLTAFFVLGGLVNFVALSFEVMRQPQPERPRTAQADRRILQNLSDTLSVETDGGTVALYEDTHGGFHGDGSTCCTVTFDTASSPKEEIAGSSSWRSLPLTENLTAAAYGLHWQEDDTEPAIGPLAMRKESLCYFPPIENGYYYFEDRSSEATHPGDDSALFDRYSYNFTLAIYDTDSETLYYYELDT